MVTDGAPNAIVRVDPASHAIRSFLLRANRPGRISTLRRSITRVRSGARLGRAARPPLPPDQSPHFQASFPRNGCDPGGVGRRAGQGMPLPLALDAPQGTPLHARRRKPGGALAPRPLRGRRVAWERGEEDGAGPGHALAPRDQEHRAMAGRDTELDEFRGRVSCAALLEGWPAAWRLDRRGSTRRALKYRRGEGEIVIVNHDGRGWWDPHSSAKGDVFDLVQHLDPNLNFGQVRQVLRRFVGITPTFAEALRVDRRTGPERPLPERWRTRPRLRRGFPVWGYLTQVRCLPAGVLQAADTADVVREGPYGSAWFAHRDEVGQVSHIEIRGPDFKGALRGGRKTLFRLPGTGWDVTRIAVAEAPIDALSLAAIEDIRADTIYVATGGGMGPGTEQAIERALLAIAGRPGATLASATDANAAGDSYADRHAELATAAGVPFARLRPVIGTDWNDELRHRRAA